jgi:hypothetical protein
MIESSISEGTLMRTSRVVASAALAVLLLAGCDGGGESADTRSKTATPDAEPTAEPTDEPTEEPTDTDPPVDPHPALTDLIISTSGLGPLTVGVAPGGNPGEAMITWDAEFCLGEMWEGDGDPGRWVPNGYGTDINYMGGETNPFYVDADNTAVNRVDVMGTSPHTVEGVRIGTLLIDLQAAYPGLSGPFAGPVSQVWWVQDAAGTMVFETQGGDMIAPGAPDQVILIRVLAAGQPVEWAAANSGNVAGACF